tara:strand:+ start:2216 stop:2428 length:213 start_codon:yes stop_codon:yes gene_type:complete
MSIESLKKISETSEIYPEEIPQKQIKFSKKVNIEVLKKRVFLEKKRERFQNRVLVAMFCLSIAILGYIVV